MSSQLSLIIVFMFLVFCCAWDLRRQGLLRGKCKEQPVATPVVYETQVTTNFIVPLRPNPCRPFAKTQWSRDDIEEWKANAVRVSEMHRRTWNRTVS